LVLYFDQDNSILPEAMPTSLSVMMMMVSSLKHDDGGCTTELCPNLLASLGSISPILKYDAAAPEAMLKYLGRMNTLFEHGEGGCATDGFSPEAMHKSPFSGKFFSLEAMPR
jgi:hypothetical protein